MMEITIKKTGQKIVFPSPDYSKGPPNIEMMERGKTEKDKPFIAININDAEVKKHFLERLKMPSHIPSKNE